jgi:penicillin-binding protein 2
VPKDKFIKSVDSDWYKQRIFGVIICVLTAFAIIIARLIYLQVIVGAEYRHLSLNNSIRLKSIEPPRGLILDRKGRRLADNRPSFDVNITLKDTRNLNQTVESLSRHLALSSEEIRSKIRDQRGLAAYKPILVKQDIGRNALAAIEVHKHELPGVSVDVKVRRNYVHNRRAAHLIGYLSEISPEELSSDRYPGYRRGDYIGKFGAEKTYEHFLRGERGGRQVEVNANGQVVRELKTVAAKPGQSVYLTIDQDLQRKAEELLSGVAGAVVAVEPDSGRVLVLASNPSFDQNDFGGRMSYEQWDALVSNPFRPMENKAIQGEYPPGSTYKILTAIAGLEEGVVDERTEFHCPGFYRFGNRVYRCWKRGGHGRVDIRSAISESCDVFFYLVGERLGVDRLAWYAKACGLGAKTGIDLEQEASGLIPTAAWKKQRTGVSWQPGETLSLAIGQGFNLVTPLQMAVFTAAVANGGTLYVPRILEAIKDSEEQTQFAGTPQILGRLPVSPENLAIVREGLQDVVNGERGTARRIRMKHIAICGKTGTSQVISRRDSDPLAEKDRPPHMRAHAWFVAYAPAAKPAIAVAVVVEHGEHGSSAAAPVAGELIKAYFRRVASDHLMAVRK